VVTVVVGENLEIQNTKIEENQTNIPQKALIDRELRCRSCRRTLVGQLQSAVAPAAAAAVVNEELVAGVLHSFGKSSACADGRHQACQDTAASFSL
jgi:hypothetical protein